MGVFLGEEPPSEQRGAQDFIFICDAIIPLSPLLW